MDDGGSGELKCKIKSHTYNLVNSRESLTPESPIAVKFYHGIMRRRRNKWWQIRSTVNGQKIRSIIYLK